MSESAYFQLSDRLQRGIVSTLRWTQFRSVQDLTIEAVLDGNNAVVLAPTAGGKTEAAFFPVLDRLHLEPARGVGCIYVSPLRALLNNQEARVQRLAELVGLRAFKWHGDVGAGPRRRFLKDPTEVLMTTPESLEVMLTSGQDVEHGLFRHLRFVIVDEIHAFADGDRGAHLMAVMERLHRRSDTDVQRIGLSATVGNPEGLCRWMQGTSERPYAVVDPPREPVRRKIAVHYIGGGLERSASAALPLAYGRKSIFFTQGRSDTEDVNRVFEGRGIPVFAHHSSVSREFREEAEGKFAGSEGPATLVSTSTLELGIDVGDLDVILQLDAPATVSSFLQRMGRSGRRPGSYQHIEFFTGDEDSLLQAVALVSLARRGFVENVEPSRQNTPVLVHQILAQVLENPALSPEALWRVLQGAHPFSNIGRDTFDRVVEHLLQTNILRKLEGFLVFGEEGERIFANKNFFDLYSAFETPGEVVVKTREGRVVGTLDTEFVRKMESETFSFLLAGKTWQAVDVDLDRGLVVAMPVARGEAPSWHGAGGLLSRRVAEEMRNVLLDDEDPLFVNEAGRLEIERLRNERRHFLEQDRCPMTHQGNKLQLHTYAGIRVNATIAALLATEEFVRVRGFGDLEIELEALGKTPDFSLICAELQSLRDVDERLTEAQKTDLVSEKNRGRLAKFQPYLPPDLEGSYLATQLFDFTGTAELARESSFPVV